MKDSDFGILLHRTSYSESSLILTYFTKKLGIKKFIFQGGKKKGQQFFPLVSHELIYYHRPDSDLWKLTQTTNIRPQYDFQFDPVKSSIAFFMVDIMKKCLHEEKDEFLYAYLEAKIEVLNATKELQLFPISFLIELSDHLGFQPITDQVKATYLDLKEGHFLAHQPLHIHYCKGKVVEHLFQLFRNEKPILNASERKEVLDQLLLYFELHIPNFNLTKSLEIIQSILHD